MAAPRLIMKLAVTQIRHEPGDVLVVQLKHLRRPHLPMFEPGSHVDVHLPDGKVRQYSLCGDPQDAAHYLIAIKREEVGRGGSDWLHAHVGVGAILPVSAPRNHFPIKPVTGPVLLLAGGIGITPLLAMARRLAGQALPFELHYFSRSKPLTPLLSDIARAVPVAQVRLHFDDEPNTRQDLGALLANQPEGAQIYCCGPAGFMAAVAKATEHWSAESVHFEAFQPPSFNDSPPQPFAIELRGGRRVEVDAHTTALVALRAAGVPLMASCENGVCGTCECGLLEGKPIHRDAVLSIEDQKRRFIPCISRAEGVLKLDL